MSRMVLLSAAALLLSACTSSWDPVDHDGDGISALDGDCWDALEGPEGSGLTGADIFPGAAELYYDGIDQDCGQDDDYDADGDGFVPDEYVGLATLLAPGTGELPGGDCWDDPASIPPEHAVVSASYTDKNGTQLDWAQPTAPEVNPAADDTWYDGVDQDCAGNDDFDQDGDGFATESYPDQSGAYGDDCIDGNELDDDNFAGDAAVDVNPGAAEVWYDGTDQDCDDNDCDQDGDGWDGPTDGSPTDFCVPEECEDQDPDIYQDPTIPEVWYNGIDENCDGDDGDQDGDGYWIAGYDELVETAGGEPLTIPSGWAGDCWDVPLSVADAPADFVAINGFDQPDAQEVFPAASDTWYDAVDQDCAGDDDFDSDSDGYATDAYANRGGSYGSDCDDTEGSVFPGQFETFYDGTDDNCDGNDGDADGDGYWSADYETLVTAAGGTPLDIPSDCGIPGTLSCAADCDDGNANVHPDRLEDCGTAADDDCDGDTNFDAEEYPGMDGDAIGCTEYYQDDDRDGFGDLSGTPICYCEAYDDYDQLTATDCDDSDDDTYPGADEYCDGHDDDCDGSVDEDSAVDAVTWYADTDGDGYGDASVTDVECYQPTGYVILDTDCDDSRALTNPAATEYCNEIHDDDCDGTIDEPDAADALTWYLDADLDGYGDPSISDVQCELYQPSGYILDNTDCDDSDSGDYPGATEIIANDDDEDCDGGDTCYEDLDGDTFGTSATVLSSDTVCSDAGESYNDDDCDDGEATTYPGADEYCDGHDDDCDGDVDEDGSVDVLTWYADSDGDGYGDPAVDDIDCYEPTGYVADNTDCDDSDSGDYPGATEIVGNSDDESCDGTEICYDDDDNDGYLDSSGDTRSSTDTDCYDPYEGTNTDPTTDCDDTDAGDYPGATEIVGNQDDEDCDGGEICFEDDDDDGYLDSSGDTRVSADTDCTDALEGTNTDPTTDCDDSDSGDYPGATEIVGNEDDEDCDGGEICYNDDDDDGYLDSSGDTITSSDADCKDPYESPSSTATTDCDDFDAQAYPGATEYCDGHDDDCDGEVDEDGSADVRTWYADSDGDGYGNPSVDDIDCYEPTGYVADNTDCDDSDSGDYPGATEIVGNQDDESCDGTEICYEDDDNDGYLDSSGDTRVSSDTDCTDDYEGTNTDPTTDCDDSDSGDYPGATEIVGNSDDESCDGTEICFDDDDDDGYLDSSGDTRSSSDTDCYDPFEGELGDPTTDCDDGAASVYPGAPETVADGIDQDCSGGDTCYADGDGDTYGTSSTVVSANLLCTDSGESLYSTDCDDSSASAYPGATETVADGIDQDCSGGDTCYADGDGDSYGTTATVVSGNLSCTDSGESLYSTDCDDSSASAYPGATETVADGIDQDCSGGDTCYTDSDGDGYGSSVLLVSTNLSCGDAGEADDQLDCDDSDDAQYPGADEYCNSEDDDCDGVIDEDDAVDVATWYLDFDGDSYGRSSITDLSCNQPTGYVANATDCLDTDAAINPGATEVCDSVDNDCDGDIDDDDASLDASTGSTWYADGDGDSYGDSGDTVQACLVPSGYLADSSDCDDGDAAINPAATEVCDDVDNDCDGDIDDDDASLDASTGSTWYADGDEDGYGAPGDTTMACDLPSGYVAGTGDCDDGDASIHTGADEYCGSVDHDCDGAVGDDDDDAVDAGSWYHDFDGDGYGDPGDSVSACLQPTGYLADSSDCFDSSDAIYPGALEICDDGLINDCSEPGGGTAGNACPGVGDLVINEAMCDPSVVADTAGEWIEIYNATGADIDLEGMMLLDDGSDSHQIASSVVVPAGDYAVLAIAADATVEVDYVYSGYTLANSVDEIVLATYGTDGTDGTEIDRVDYGSSWPNNAGNAMALGTAYQDATDNDLVGSWFAADCLYDLDNSGVPIFDQGTPGDDNDLGCPEIAQLDPSEVFLAGGDTVTITGTNLDYGAGDILVTVGVWGVDSEITPSASSSTEVDFTAPASAATGSDTVIIDNGKYLYYLEDGLNWVETEAAYLWWPIPGSHASWGRDVYDSLGGTTLEAGETTEVLYGRLHHSGVAACTVEPTDYTVELGFGELGTDPRYHASWYWVAATFNAAASGCTGDTSEYQGSLGPLPAGDFSFTFRYSYGGDPWVYGLLRYEDGSGGYVPGDVFDLAELGSFSVN
jgi:hypothetical protein